MSKCSKCGYNIQICPECGEKLPTLKEKTKNSLKIAGKDLALGLGVIKRGKIRKREYPDDCIHNCLLKKNDGNGN